MATVSSASPPLLPHLQSSTFFSSFCFLLLPYYFYRTFFAFCQSFLSLFAIILTSKSWKRSSIPRVFTQETSNQLYPILTELHLHHHPHKTPLSSMTFTWQCSTGDSLCDVQAMLLIFAFTALKFRKKPFPKDELNPDSVSHKKRRGTETSRLAKPLSCFGQCFDNVLFTYISVLSSSFGSLYLPPIPPTSNWFQIVPKAPTA